MRRLLTLFLLFISIQYAYPQFSKQDMDRRSAKLKKDVLDKASVRCVYEMIQVYKGKNTDDSGYLTDTLTLDIGKNVSCFYDEKETVRDSLGKVKTSSLYKSGSVKMIHPGTPADKFTTLKEEGGTYNESRIGNKSKIYKNRKKQEVVTTDIKGTLNVFKCTENIPPQHWVITNDTLTVLGYVCQKATTTFRGRSYSAWFANEIPLNEGPWKLYGLPGLILKAISDDQIFSFIAIGLENMHENTEITMSKDDYIKSDRKQMEKLYNENITSIHSSYIKDGHLYVGFRQEPWILEPIELE